MSQWQLEGEAAEFYERYAVPFLLGPWAPRLVDLAALREGERVLDIACGTGVVARLAARRVGATGRVVGLDLNAGMLAVGRKLPRPPGISIDFREGSALALPFGDGEFDVALCQQGLQFFPDRPLALREMRRVLAPAGRLALAVWTEPASYSQAMREALARHVSLEAADSTTIAHSLGDADALSRLVEEAGFRTVAVRRLSMMIRYPPLDEFIPNHLAGTPAARAVAAVSDSARAALVAHVQAAMQSYVDGYGVVFPVAVNVATAAA
jgi:ubiquinone/menaquinone biosynthesis C-methylase UbiE